MTTSLAFGILAVYFLMLIIVAHYTSKGADTNTFFTANKQSPWWLVAIGMIGTSISGVTFISVPDRKSTRLNSSHSIASRMPSSA